MAAPSIFTGHPRPRPTATTTCSRTTARSLTTLSPGRARAQRQPASGRWARGWRCVVVVHAAHTCAPLRMEAPSSLPAQAPGPTRCTPAVPPSTATWRPRAAQWPSSASRTASTPRAPRLAPTAPACVAAARPQSDTAVGCPTPPPRAGWRRLFRRCLCRRDVRRLLQQHRHLRACFGRGGDCVTGGAVGLVSSPLSIIPHPPPAAPQVGYGQLQAVRSEEMADRGAAAAPPPHPSRHGRRAAPF